MPAVRSFTVATVVRGCWFRLHRSRLPRTVTARSRLRFLRLRLCGYVYRLHTVVLHLPVYAAVWLTLRFGYRVTFAVYAVTFTPRTVTHWVLPLHGCTTRFIATNTRLLPYPAAVHILVVRLPAFTRYWLPRAAARAVARTAFALRTSGCLVYCHTPPRGYCGLRLGLYCTVRSHTWFAVYCVRCHACLRFALYRVRYRRGCCLTLRFAGLVRTRTAAAHVARGSRGLLYTRFWFFTVRGYGCRIACGYAVRFAPLHTFTFCCTFWSARSHYRLPRLHAAFTAHTVVVRGSFTRLVVHTRTRLLRFPGSVLACVTSHIHTPLRTRSTVTLRTHALGLPGYRMRCSSGYRGYLRCRTFTVTFCPTASSYHTPAPLHVVRFCSRLFCYTTVALLPHRRFTPLPPDFATYYYAGYGCRLPGSGCHVRSGLPFLFTVAFGSHGCTVTCRSGLRGCRLPGFCRSFNAALPATRPYRFALRGYTARLPPFCCLPAVRGCYGSTTHVPLTFTPFDHGSACGCYHCPSSRYLTGCHVTLPSSSCWFTVTLQLVPHVR